MQIVFGFDIATFQHGVKIFDCNILNYLSFPYMSSDKNHGLTINR